MFVPNLPDLSMTYHIVLALLGIAALSVLVLHRGWQVPVLQVALMTPQNPGHPCVCLSPSHSFL